MDILLIGLAVVAALIFLPRLFSSAETKLFRRVWAAEKLGGYHGQDSKFVAVRALAVKYGIDFDGDLQSARQAIGNLLSAATEFDVRNRNNLGVQVMPVIALTLLAFKGERLPELSDDLIRMSNVDGLALMDSLRKNSK